MFVFAPSRRRCLRWRDDKDHVTGLHGHAGRAIGVRVLLPQDALSRLGQVAKLNTHRRRPRYAVLLPPGVLGRLGQVAKLNPYRRLKPRPLYVPLLLQSVPGHLGQVAKLNPYLASWRTGPVSPLEPVLPLLVVVEKVVGIKIRALTPRYFGGLRIDFECRLFDNCTALVILLLLLIAPLLIYSFLLIAHFPLLLLIAHFHSPLLC